MSRKVLIALIGVLLAVPATALAQGTGTVAGTVLDSTTTETLPGVNVVIQELDIGAATGANGKFRITGVPAGEHTLVASFVGYSRKRIPITVQAGGTINVKIRMAPQAIGMEQMVVTALGEERTARSISASIQEVSGGDLAEVGQENFISSLEGRVSGVDIKTSSTMGGSSNIFIRGIVSLQGNNQPLIVIDGIPIDNSTNQGPALTSDNIGSQQSGGNGGFDFGNAAKSINPDNIESVSVLKGASAAALYGSRAANGVIQITTKDGSGQEGIGVSFSSATRFAQRYELMDYQNQYGGGAGSNPFGTVEGGSRLSSSDDQLRASFEIDESWGPPLDGRMVREWFSFDDVNGVQGQTTPWDPNPDNIENFMSNSGATFENNIALSQGGDSYNYRLSFNQKNMETVFPDNNREEYRFQLNGTVDLSDKVTVTGNANYSFEETSGRISTGYFCQNPQCLPGTNPFAQFNTFGQRQLELGPDSPMRDFQRPNGDQRGWNFLGVEGATSSPTRFNFTDNPYVTRLANGQEDDQQRFFGRGQLAYDFLPNFTATWKVATDFRTERRDGQVAEVSVEDPERFRQTVIETQEVNSELKFDYDRNLTESISLESFLAGRIRWEEFEFNRQETEGGLAAPGLFNVENSIGRPTVFQNRTQKQVNSLYGRVTLGYNENVFITGTLRNDWASTLPSDDNSFIYPSVQGNVIFSEYGPFQDLDFLSFGKIRASWAQVGNDTGAFQLTNVFPVNVPFGDQPVQEVDRTSANPNLQREITTEREVGLDLRFFSNRLVLNATYYNKDTEDQILQSDISATSGINATVINAGEISNTGVETSLTATPIQTQDVQWDVTVNWATNSNEVEELAEGINTFEVGSAIFGPDFVAREGEPFGTFLGDKFVRDQNGKIVYNRDGSPRSFNTQQNLGDFQPDWTGGVSTTVSYKGFTASALVDGQMGGQIWSLSNTFGTFSGMIESTLPGRETGIVPGGVVLPEGTSPQEAAEMEGTPFSEAEGAVDRVQVSSFWKSFFGSGIGEAFMFDATHLKLREISLSYRFPQQWINQLPALQQATLSFTGRNLVTLYKETPNIDPSLTLSAGNVQGIEAGQIPSRRTFGVRVNLQF